MDDQRNLWEKWIPALERELANELQKAPAPSEVHAIDHVHRVRERCVRLGERLDADLEILIAAVYLHDLGRHHIPETAHGALSAQMAAPVLELIDFPKKKRAAVLHAIRVHDVSAAPEDRNTLESKILYDADKIDTLGVVGVLRYIRHYYGKKSIDFMLDEIEARWRGLTLPQTRDLALTDYTYIKDYFIRLKKELGDAADPH